MTLTVTAIWIPIILTIVLLCIMFRPYHSSGMYDFGQIFRVGWIVPIMLVWIGYLYYGWSQAENELEKVKEVQVERVEVENE